MMKWLAIVALLLWEGGTARADSNHDSAWMRDALTRSVHQAVSEDFRIAQLSMTGFGMGGGSAVSTFQGIGDVKSGAIIYWSTARAYTASYAVGGGAMFDVVDTATGLTSCTFHALSTGFVNTTECNATACAVACSVTKIYNQANLGTDDAIQATLVNMPTVTFSAINGLPAMTFLAANSQVLTTASLVTQAQPYSVSVVYKRTAVNNGGFVSSNGTGFEIRGASGGNTEVFGCGSSINVTATDNAYHGLNTTCNGSSSAYNIDGTDNTGQVGGSNGPTGVALRIGKASGGNAITGQVTETFIYAAATTPTERGNLYTNMHGVNGYNGAF